MHFSSPSYNYRILYNSVLGLRISRKSFLWRINLLSMKHSVTLTHGPLHMHLWNFSPIISDCLQNCWIIYRHWWNQWPLKKSPTTKINFSCLTSSIGGSFVRWWIILLSSFSSRLKKARVSKIIAETCETCE